MDAEKLVADLTGRVRDALAQAEAGAREIVDEAEARARDLVADAEAEAKRIRARAEGEADERLAKVREALAGLEGALGASDTAEPAPAAEVEPQPAIVPEPEPPPIPEPTPPAEPEPMPPAEPEPFPPSPEIQPPAPAQPDREAPEAAPEPGTASANGGTERSTDKTGARIVATKMALDGASREEISTYLAEHYDLENADGLLDDVLARAKR